MTASDKKTIQTLDRLYRLCKAGQWGFQTVAENAQNRGLKVLLKSFAQQRADFAQELADEIERLSGSSSGRRSLRGIVHRGRINIRATLTIGARNVEELILREARIGENVVGKAYEKALESGLPAESREIVDNHYRQIMAVRDQIENMLGRSGRRLIVRLFDTTDDAKIAVQVLKGAGFDTNSVELVDIDQVSIYDGPGSSVNESAISGAIGGALWGGLFGLAAGVSAFFIPGMGMLSSNVLINWAAAAIVGLIVGAFFGIVLGVVIGHANREEDRYLHDSSLTFGRTLLRLDASDERADEATHILHEVNAAARARTIQEAVVANQS